MRTTSDIPDMALNRPGRPGEDELRRLGVVSQHDSKMLPFESVRDETIVPSAGTRPVRMTAGPGNPLAIAVGGLTAIGVACAAACATRAGAKPAVGVTAWVAAAIVGTAATISAARNS